MPFCISVFGCEQSLLEPERVLSPEHAAKTAGTYSGDLFPIPKNRLLFPSPFYIYNDAGSIYVQPRARARYVCIHSVQQNGHYFRFLFSL